MLRANRSNFVVVSTTCRSVTAAAAEVTAEHGGAALLGGPRGGGHSRPERLRPARKVEVDEVNA
jgi:hypothetical protein